MPRFSFKLSTTIFFSAFIFLWHFCFDVYGARPKSQTKDCKVLLGIISVQPDQTYITYGGHYAKIKSADRDNERFAYGYVSNQYAKWDRVSGEFLGSKFWTASGPVKQATQEDKAE